MRLGKGSIFCVATWSCACALGISGCLPKNDSQPSTITTASLPAGVVDQPYSASVSGSGGMPPYTWAVSPALPASLSLNGSTGAITGTPGAEGTSSHTFSMIDSASPQQVVQKSLTLTITQAPAALLITTVSLPDGFVGQAYNQPVVASGGTAPLSWSIVAGTLPLVLNLNPTTGVISGTPTASGTSSLTVRVADSGGQEDTQAFSIRINP
ncbi:MAG TPA: Ig domain-containing protein, partial [Nitrospira sp.]